MRVILDALLHRTGRGGVERAVEGVVKGLVEASDRLRGPGGGESTRSAPCRRNATVWFEVLLPTGSPLVEAISAAGSSVAVRAAPIRCRVERIVREQLLALRGGRCDLWHFPGYVAPLAPPREPFVVSVYDVIALTHPGLCTRANRFYYGLALPRTLRRAARIIAPSEYVRDRIAEAAPGAADRVRVIPLPLEAWAGDGGSAPGLANRTEDCAEPYVLMVGDYGPKKNLGFALEVYASLPRDVRERFALRVCGRSTGAQQRRFRRQAQSLGIEGRVRFTGYESEAALPSIYRNAAALLYPSLEEGFGLPPLEAMALGTPALVSDRGALPEIAGAAGAMVLPLDQRVFTEALCAVLRGEEALGRAPSRAAVAAVVCPSWAEYGRRLIAIYREAV